MKYDYLTQFIECNLPENRANHLDLIFPKPRFKNLALQGGGVKGIAYSGAVAAMENSYYSDGTCVLDYIETVAGTSAGSITAMMLAIGYSSKEIAYLIDSDRLQSLNDSVNTLSMIIGYLSKNDRIGMHHGKKLEKFIKDLLMEKVGDKNITFRELHALKAKGIDVKDLIITGTNITTNEIEYYSYVTHPDMKISDAVRISAGFPIHFKAKVLGDQQQRVDGGLKNNFPINAFEDPLIQEKMSVRDANIPYHGQNMQTMGITLGDGEEGLTKHPKTNQMKSVLSALIDNTAINLQNPIYRMNTATIQCNVDGKNIYAMDMNIPESTQKELVKKGYGSTSRFLDCIPSSQKTLSFETVHDKYRYLMKPLIDGGDTDIPMNRKNIKILVRYLHAKMQQADPRFYEDYLTEIQSLSEIIRDNLNIRFPNEPDIEDILSANNIDSLLQIESEYVSSRPIKKEMIKNPIQANINQLLNEIDIIREYLDPQQNLSEEYKTQMRSMNLMIDELYRLLSLQSQVNLHHNSNQIMEDVEIVLKRLDAMYVNLLKDSQIAIPEAIIPSYLYDKLGFYKSMAISISLSPLYIGILTLELLILTVESLINLCIYLYKVSMIKLSQMGIHLSKRISGIVELKNSLSKLRKTIKNSYVTLSSHCRSKLIRENVDLARAYDLIGKEYLNTDEHLLFSRCNIQHPLEKDEITVKNDILRRIRNNRIAIKNQYLSSTEHEKQTDLYAAMIEKDTQELIDIANKFDFKRPSPMHIRKSMLDEKDVNQIVIDKLIALTEKVNAYKNKPDKLISIWDNNLDVFGNDKNVRRLSDNGLHQLMFDTLVNQIEDLLTKGARPKQ